MRENSRNNYFATIELGRTISLVEQMIGFIMQLEEYDLYLADTRASIFLIEPGGRLKMIDIDTIVDIQIVTAVMRSRSVHRICRAMILILKQAAILVPEDTDIKWMQLVLDRLHELHWQTRKGQTTSIGLNMLKPICDEICRNAGC
jgi:hypothetical protein